MEGKPKLLITVDVENWFNSRLFNVERARQSKEAERFSTPYEDLNVVLEVLDKYNVKATFFVLGSLLEDYKYILGAIQKKGQEVGMHAYNHGEFRDEKEFSADLKKGLEVFKDHGITPKGYRHPYFMINQRKLKILAQTFNYDASLVPSVHIPGHYGKLMANAKPRREGTLTELPLSVMPLIRLPAATGWYYRNLGQRYVTSMISYSLKHYKYAHICLHTWEFTEKNRVQGVPFHVFRNCGKPMENLVKELVKLAADNKAETTTCSQYVDQAADESKSHLNLK